MRRRESFADEEKLFLLTAKYDQDWVKENSYDGLTLYCAESLCQVLPLKEGMRVLDLGCGWAITSIFLAQEFGVEVWAVDLERSATDNYRRVKETGMKGQVIPLKTDARNLPFPENFFDAVISIDAYGYFGLDERYLSYVVSFIKTNSWLGIVDGAFTRELLTPV